MNGPPPHLLVVGDSIALGVTDIVSDEIRGMAANNFVDRLRGRLVGWQINVDGAVHRTSDDVRRLLPALLRRHRPDVVLFVIGGSDVDINWKRFILTGGRRVRPNTAIERFEANLRQLATEVRAAGGRAVLSDLPAHDLAERGRIMSEITGRDVPAMLAAAGGQSESDRHHSAYADVIERVASETGTPVARWAERIGLLPAVQRFGPDAVHPSEAAHAVIADVVAELLTATPALPRFSTATPS